MTRSAATCGEGRATGQRLRDNLDACVVEGYGHPRAAGILRANPRGAAARAGTAGLRLPDTEVRIVADDGRDVRAGGAGELVAREPQVAGGGGLRPGEVSVMNPDGFVTVMGQRGSAAAASRAAAASSFGPSAFSSAAGGDRPVAMQGP